MANKTISSPIPTGGGTPVGTAGPDYSTQIATWMAEVRDAMAVKGRPTDWNIDADVDYKTFGTKDMGIVRFVNQDTAPAAATDARSFHSLAGDVYWIDDAGQVVRITNDGSLDITSAGGIVGDYGQGGVDAQLTYADGTGVYTFQKDVSPSVLHAIIASGPVRLIEYLAGKTNYVEHKSPASLAASYSLTWLTALPAVYAGDTVLAVDSTGAISATSSPQVASLTVDGVTTQGGDVDLQGNKVRHTERTFLIPASIGVIFTDSDWSEISAEHRQSQVSGAVINWDLSWLKYFGARVKSLRVRHWGADATNKKLHWESYADGAKTVIAENITMTWNGSPGYEGITGRTDVLGAGKSYVCRYVSSLTAALDLVYHLEVICDVVA